MDSLFQHLAAVDGVEQHHHFPRRRDILSALLGGFEVHHFPAQPGMGQAERVEHGVDVRHADAVDEDIGRGVVADCDHHGGEIAQRDARDAWSQSVHDVAVGNKVGRLHGVEIRQLELALLRLQVKIGQDGDLNGAGLREHFVFMQQVVVAGREVFDGDSHDAVEMLVDVLNAGLEFLPEDLLFAGGGSGGFGQSKWQREASSKARVSRRGLLKARIVAGVVQSQAAIRGVRQRTPSRRKAFSCRRSWLPAVASPRFPN